MYYGIATRQEIELFTGEVCAFFDDELIINDEHNQKYIDSYNMLMETMCAETLLGNMPDTDDKQGMGLPQIDRIKYDDIIENCQEHNKKIWDKWQIDINLVTFESLKYNWKLSIIFERLGYKRIFEAFPSTREERSRYWKKYWNTYKGVGKPSDFMERSERFLGVEL